MPGRILVAEDDVQQARVITAYLEREGHSVVVVHNGQEALQAIRQKQPDLAILDVMMPHVDGLDVCRIVRTESNIPILMVTARTSEEDVLLGLDLGADDYITKPYSPRVLAARVRALLRRTGQPEDGTITAGHLTISPDVHEVRRGRDVIDVTPKEFQILLALAMAPGRVFARQALLEAAFGFEAAALARTVDVHVANLRKKIEPDPANPTYILTVYGVGYKLATPT